MMILTCDGTLRHFWLRLSEQEVTGTDRQLNSSQPGLWSHSLRARGSRQRLVTFLREHSVTVWLSQSLVNNKFAANKFSSYLYFTTTHPS